MNSMFIIWITVSGLLSQVRHCTSISQNWYTERHNEQESPQSSVNSSQPWPASPWYSISGLPLSKDWQLCQIVTDCVVDMGTFPPGTV